MRISFSSLLIAAIAPASLWATGAIATLNLNGLAVSQPFDPAAIKQAFAGSKSAPTALVCNQTLCKGTVDVAATSGTLIVNADASGKIVSVSFEFPLDAFDAVDQGFTDRFGQPVSATAMQMQDGFGARFQSRKIVWVKGDQMAMLDEQREKLGRNKAIFYLRRMSAEDARALAPAAQSPAHH